MNDHGRYLWGVSPIRLFVAAAVAIGVVIIVSVAATTLMKEDVRVNDSFREMCFQYRRWEQLAHDRVGSMDRHCQEHGS